MFDGYAEKCPDENNPVKNNQDVSLLTANFMPRLRIDRLFDQATACEAVYVVAGAGYGKTQAVHHYVKQQPDAVVRWLQMTDNDNMGSRYWESLTHSVSLDNPVLAAKLRELGFPDTIARFKQFAGIVKELEHKSQKAFVVLDDFHLIHSKQMLTFVQRCAQLRLPGACEIFISRNEPDINSIYLFSKGKACMISEEDLRFSDDEIADFLKQSNITFSAEDILRISEATKGWALAIKLLALVLARTDQDLDRALETMKQNVFKLFETEAFGDFPESVQKRLVQLSLISNLPQTTLSEIISDSSFVQYAPMLKSFIWFDSLICEFRIHPLFLEFLQTKQYILSEEEQLDTYKKAAQWCLENKLYLDAITYFAKSRQHDRLLDMMLKYPVKLPPDTCDYILGILEGLSPGAQEENNRSIMLLKALFEPRMFLGLGRYQEATERSMEIIRKLANSDTPISLFLLYLAYNNLAYLDMYACTATHEYKAPQYLEKATEFLKPSVVLPTNLEGPFGVADLRSFACLVGVGAKQTEFDQFLESAKQSSIHIAKSHHTMYWGYDDLVACELSFFKNQLQDASMHAHNAIYKAHEKKQHSIEAMAQQYILRIALHEGDYPLANEMLKQLQSHLDNPGFWNRQLLYDLFVGSFYIHIGLPDMASPWLAIDEKDTGSEIHIPTRELIVGVRYHIAKKNFKQALAILSNSLPGEPLERFYFGEMILSLLLAVVRYKTGDVAGAARSFQKAYEMSFDGEFEMPFIELGKLFGPLAAAALELEDCGIPEQWQVAIERKASIYMKKTAIVANSFKKARKLSETISLSEREQEVLMDLYHGLSREEIAENRYMSINTVKSILRSVFTKLDAYNNVDAIRIAIEKKLIEL